MHDELLQSALAALRTAPTFSPDSIWTQIYEPRFAQGPLSVWLIDTTADGRRAIEYDRRFISITGADPLLASGVSTETPATFWTDNPALMQQLGQLFFGQQTLRPDVFHSDNSNLFTSVYFPVQLANDGCGIFFDERLISRLHTLGLLDPSDHVDYIVDKGGWGSLDSLTASIEVQLRTSHGPRRRVLLGTALVPPPPVRPEQMAAVLESYRLSLLAAGLRSCVLAINDAVVYHRYVTPLISALSNESPHEFRKCIISQAVAFAAFIDSGRATTTSLPNDACDMLVYTDPWSSDDDIHTADLISSLGVDDMQVFWSSFSAPPSSLRAGPNSCWKSLAPALHHAEYDHAWHAYLDCLHLIQ